MVDEDLDYIYVVVPADTNDDTENITVRRMSDKQFREWVVAKGAQHNIQILPTFGRLGMETRLNLINRLIRKGVRIYRWEPDNVRRI